MLYLLTNCQRQQISLNAKVSFDDGGETLQGVRSQ